MPGWGILPGNAAVAALISTATSTTCMALYVLIIRPGMPSWATMRSGPWWMWTGGIIGAIYVAVSLNLAQRLGATVLVAVILVGQMTAAAILADHYDCSPDQQEISPLRILGVICLVVGVILIRVF